MQKKKKKKKEEGAAAVSTWNSVGTLTGVPAHPHHPNGRSARPECGLAPSTPSCLPLCSPLMTLFLVLPSCSPLRLPLSRSLSPEDRGALLQPPPPAGSGPLPLFLTVFLIPDPRGLSSPSHPRRSLALPMALSSTRSLVPTLPFSRAASSLSRSLAPSPSPTLGL